MSITRRKSKTGVEKEKEVVETRPPVTQVVEVVEEQEEPDTISAEAVNSTEEFMEEPAEETRVVEKSESEEKRRVLVDELFQKKENMSSDLTPEISVHKRSPSKSIMSWAIVSIVACLVVGGGLYFFSNENKIPVLLMKSTPTPTSTPVSTPTPVELKKDAISIEVLNGSGVSGVAAKMKALLEEKGYTVSDTGNADNYDYINTQINVKSDKEGYIKLLEEDIKGTYSLGTSSAILKENASADVQIIVGSE